MKFRVLLFPAGALEKGAPHPTHTLPRLQQLLDLCGDVRFDMVIFIGGRPHPVVSRSAADVIKEWAMRYLGAYMTPMPEIVTVPFGNGPYEVVSLGISTAREHLKRGEELELHVFDLAPNCARMMVSALVGHGQFLHLHMGGWSTAADWASGIVALPLHVVDPHGRFLSLQRRYVRRFV